MTTDHDTRAREIVAEYHLRYGHFGGGHVFERLIATALKEQAEAERERCAKIVEGFSTGRPGDICDLIAADIRAALSPSSGGTK
jgi:hypothetical protein